MALSTRNTFGASPHPSSQTAFSSRPASRWNLSALLLVRWKVKALLTLRSMNVQTSPCTSSAFSWVGRSVGRRGEMWGKGKGRGRKGMDPC
jgi:hypothetical protein